MKLSKHPFEQPTTMLNSVLLLGLLVVSGVRGEFNGQLGLSLLNTVIDIPMGIYNLFVKEAEAFQGLVTGDEPTSTVKLVTAEGYRCDTHEIITQDGYILDLFRISHGRRSLLAPQIQNTKSNQSSTERNKLPVILFHGIGQSSAAWVLNSPREDALGFHLVDKGFDVWLAEQRGTLPRHVSLHPSSTQFWEYDNHQVGVNDLSAIIDYVLQMSKQERVNFVGFSTGNAAFLILNSKKPEYSKKVGVAVFLAPAGIYYDTAAKKNGQGKGKTMIGAPLLLKTLQGMGDLLRNVSGVVPLATRLMHWLLPVLCSRGVDWFGLCLSTLRTHVGDDRGLISQAKLASALATFPNPVTVRSLTHMAQQMNSGQFAEFDFGANGNKEAYQGSSFPPAYNLSRVQVPVAIIVGQQDLIATERNAVRLAKQLPQLLHFERVSSPFFTHASFHLATGAAKLVNGRVVQILLS